MPHRMVVINPKYGGSVSPGSRLKEVKKFAGKPHATLRAHTLKEPTIGITATGMGYEEYNRIIYEPWLLKQYEDSQKPWYEGLSTR
jgi:hypothetical protein